MAQFNSLLVTGNAVFLNPINGNARNGVYYVKGTQTASTSAWTGNVPVSSLYDGLTIMYYLPYASTSTSVTLNLTLSNGTTTGAKNCYYSNGRLTTHYGKGCNIVMTYHPAGTISVDGTATTDDRWIANANYADGDTKVRQTLQTGNANRPILLSNADISNTNTNIDNLVYRNNSIYANPSTGRITATSFGTNSSGTSSSGLGSAGLSIMESNIPVSQVHKDVTSNGGKLTLSGTDAKQTVEIWSDSNNSGNITLKKSDATTDNKTRVEISSNSNGAIHLKNSSATTTISLTASNGNISATKLNGADIGSLIMVKTKSFSVSYGGQRYNYSTVSVAETGYIAVGIVGFVFSSVDNCPYRINISENILTVGIFTRNGAVSSGTELGYVYVLYIKDEILA